MTVVDEKKALRTRMLQQRNELDMISYREHCNEIYEKVKNLSELKRAMRVHTYVSSIANEIDTLGLLYHLFDEGKTVIVPKCGPGKRELRHLRIRSLNELKPGGFGLMEPEYQPENEMKPAALDIVIVPMVAYDRKGLRLGMGGGYYDTFLSDVTCTTVGLAYSFQELDALPHEDHDSKLDIIINEKEIIRVSHE